VNFDNHRVRLVLLDELGLFRASLSRLLAADAGFEVAGECATAAEALQILSRAEVDVILSDFDIQTEHGDGLISAARQAGYQGRFLIVAGILDVQKSAMALKDGASGIFLKSEAPERLIHAIRLVANGEIWVDPKVIQLLADQSIDRYARMGNQAGIKHLDDRQRDVLAGIVAGLSNRKIGDNLGLSESSIKNVLQKLFAKTAVRTRSQLVRLALQGSFGASPEFMSPRPEEMALAGRHSANLSAHRQSHE
jgi:DNA-binding NarL/FixJ family response regulator